MARADRRGGPRGRTAASAPSQSTASAASTTSAAAPLRFELLAQIRVAVDAVVVDVEPVSETEDMVKHVCADKRAGTISRIVKHARERRRSGFEHHPVVADPVHRWQRAGHDGRVRRQRQRHGGAGVAEAQALGRQPVERRREPTPQAIRAQGIDRDQDNVAVRRVLGNIAPLRRAPAGPPEEAGSAERGRDNDERESFHACRLWHS